ncbi:M23 family metallopeptidase [uncultured Eudoraea sp.]|uniref:M23 family metallopeptidase n=1 Tax=uncultured Eudoraea sp. TaxID=1035614 RepID=UPI002601CBAF|nr:M23 family metallopeptidase [uncultured Eudoraea sp.]
MRITIILLLFFSFNNSFCQGEQSSYARLVTIFTERFNGGDYDGIYELYDSGMKNAFTRIQTRNFFENNVNRIMGNIRSMDFFTIREGAHVYRVIFDRSIADLTISLNAQSKISGLSIAPPQPLQNQILERNITPMSLPFNGEWFVFWGGLTEAQNVHIKEVSQQFAYDMLKVKDGASYEGDPSKNENYFAFGEEVIAPCDARVVLVLDGIKDNVPGVVNPDQLAGNHIVLQTTNEEYVVLAHLKEGSIVVEEGQDVLQGELLAFCGNSGNSTEPHLHLSLQNTLVEEDGVGAKLFFDRIFVNGEIRVDYLPVKEDFVRNSI